MQSSRTALLGGPAFFILWFIGAQMLYFATGGTTDNAPLPGPGEYPDVGLSNSANAHAGATILVLAAAMLLWFAAGLWSRIRSDHGVGLAAALATAAIAGLLVLQAGLTVASVVFAEELPDTSWSVYQLSNALGFESFITSVLGATTLAAVIATASRDSISKYLWWFTTIMAMILAVGGLLEGLDVLPEGRFSIIFGLWVLIAGFVLFAYQEAGADTAV